MIPLSSESWKRSAVHFAANSICLGSLGRLQSIRYPVQKLRSTAELNVNAYNSSRKNSKLTKGRAGQGVAAAVSSLTDGESKQLPAVVVYLD